MVERLYDLDELKEDFSNFEFLEAENVPVVLNEGKNHVGNADVVRLFAIKK